MKKVLFITSHRITDSDGLSNKIISQVQALRNIGFDTDFVHQQSDSLIVEMNSGEKKYSLPNKYRYLFFLFASFYLKGGEKLFPYDLIYIRNPHGGLYCLFLYFFLKNKKKLSTVVLEIPTFPYKDEFVGVWQKKAYYIHAISKLFFKKFIDIIVYMGAPQKNIWGKTCVRISNGIDLSKIKKTGKDISTNEVRSQDIDFIGVAGLSFWHGYDRLITSISKYYAKGGTRTVRFHVVGDNEPYLTQLKNLARDLTCLEHIYFYGALHGEKLDKVFEICNIGVDALARHRSGNNYNSSIKSKEYCARGIPFIKSHIDDDFIDSPFVFNVLSNDEDFNVDEIIKWYDSMSFSSSEIRKFAADNLTWECQLKFLCEK